MKVLDVSVKRTGKYISIDTKGEGKPWSVLLRGIFDLKTKTGGSFIPDATGVLIKPDLRNGKIEVEMRQ